MITLTKQEAQQVLVALESNLDCHEDCGCTGRLAGKLLRVKVNEPEPEPVAWLNKTKHGTWCADALKCEGDEPSEPLYTAPPQREWQGLTDDAIEYIIDAYWGDPPMFIEAIEAKLKEKNAI